MRYLGSIGVLLALVLVEQHGSAPMLPNVMLMPELSTGAAPSTTSTTAPSNGSTTVSTLFIPKPSGAEEIIIKIVNRPKVVVNTPQSSGNGTNGVANTFTAPSTTVAPTTTEAPTTTTSTTTTEPPTTTTKPPLPALTWSNWSYGPYYNQSGQGIIPTSITVPPNTPLKLFAAVAGLPLGTLGFTISGGSYSAVNANGMYWYGSNDCSAVHNWNKQAAGGCSITFRENGTYNVRTTYLGESIDATVRVG